VIGLEVHCQLDTRTKLFCGCEYRFGAPPNTLTCPRCTGQPGALPVLNREALALAVRTALALGAEVAPWSKFDRKNYFYCDLPKGYQISQYDRPFCTGGGITLPARPGRPGPNGEEGGENGSGPGKRVRLTRIHLEEDAGKAIHDRGDTTLVDLNRSGVPLIESVTEADLASAEEAHDYLTALKEILQYIGASRCDMEKGELRCDVNVSVHKAGKPWGAKVEVKNVNSFRFVQLAIDHEIARQIEAYESGDPSRYPVQETRHFDSTKGVTRTMRSKESAHDYRYFAEPDLPPVTVDAVFLEGQRSFLPELPAARRERYRKEMGLSALDASVLAGDRALADFFETAARASKKPKECSNWITNEILRAFGDPEVGIGSVDEMAMKPSDLAEMIDLIERGVIHNNAGRQLLRTMMKSGKRAKVLVEELGLAQVQDAGQIERWCRDALAGKEKIVADVKAGKVNAINALLGPVMKASGGKANPQVVKETLLRLVEKGL
jgi:aspartyl-tRNA(Asn)/glutamyl-tRNA(Gln) amidotransferase subunit B